MTSVSHSYVQDISRLLNPKSIAVIGASSRAGSVGEAIFKNLIAGDFKGVLYPVNPKTNSLHGVECFPSLAHIKHPIDLAIIIVPAPVVPDVLLACAAKKIPGVMIISAGFKEVGGEGAALENKIKELAKKNNISLIGPNCHGIINTDPAVNLNASFAKEMPLAGNIAFISQSGALCTAILDYAKGEKIGFSKFISMGNKAVTNELDFLLALRDDPHTDVILMYLEDLIDGKEFIRLASQITGEMHNPKPIIAIKSGRTVEGAKAASSHTGSLAGSDEVYDAIFSQSGVMRVETVQELFDYGVAFSRQPLPKGDRVAIVTNAGGPGIMATDAVIRHGLKLAQFEEATIAELKKILPPTANINNPIDVIGDAKHDRYEAAIKLAAKDPNVDAVIVILTPQAMTDVKEIGMVVANAATKMKMEPWSAKTLLASFMGVVDVTPGVKLLESAQVPHYVFPEAAVRSLAQMHRYQKNWLSRPRTEPTHYAVQKDLVQKIFDKVKEDKRQYLPEPEALKVFEAYGFPTLKTQVVKTEEDALKWAKEIGYPVVLKIVSPKIIHKVDAGGVAINLKNEVEVSASYRKILNTARTIVKEEDIWGIEVQEMAGKGQEVFLGSKRDPKFGPVVVFGLGGTFVEIFKDVSFRVAPLKSHSIDMMVSSIKSYKVLEGYRGEKSDILKIKECLGRLSQLVVDFPQIQELDINPLIVYKDGQGARLADARILLNS